MNAWDVFWFLFLFIPLCILWGMTLFDMMGRRDLVGWQKAIWAAVIIFFPWIGVFAYLIVRPRNMPMPATAGDAPYSAQQQYSPQASRTASTAQYSGDARATQ
jgi:Phospholipase_D-nuclease N-terminal